MHGHSSVIANAFGGFWRSSRSSRVDLLSNGWTPSICLDQVPALARLSLLWLNNNIYITL